MGPNRMDDDRHRSSGMAEEQCGESTPVLWRPPRHGNLEQGGLSMRTKEELCRRIEAIYPEIGECGIDVDVEWNDEKKTWIVDLKKDDKELTTHLEEQDAEACMQGKQCVALGVQIAQLKSNIQAGLG